MIQKIALSVLAVMAPFAAIQAVEPLSTDELAAHCAHYYSEPQGVDATFCVRYIQGFLDGAVATDERVAINVAAQYTESETYSERAMRTRGSQWVLQYGPTVYAEYCLGAPVSLKELVEKLVLKLENNAHTRAVLLARDTVYQMLRKEYPCDIE